MNNINNIARSQSPSTAPYVLPQRITRSTTSHVNAQTDQSTSLPNSPNSSPRSRRSGLAVQQQLTQRARSLPPQSRRSLEINHSTLPERPLNQRQREHFQNIPIFRGLTESSQTANIINAMSIEGKGITPIFWGFRKYEQGEELLPREQHTLDAFKEIATSSPVPLTTPVILADIHAEHNGIPKEVYGPYYAKIKFEAENKGLPTVWLSDIFKKLNITPEDVATEGSKRIQRTKGKAADIPKLSNELSMRLKFQAKALCERYPNVFESQLSGLSNSKKTQFYGDKGFDYAKFRAGEEVVLNRLPEYFGVNGVLPTHVADPITAEPIGVKGLFIQAKDDNNENTVNIPWKD